MPANIAQLRRLPGEQGVWVFVAADMMLFGLLFLSFIFDRSHNVELFDLSQKALNYTQGGINTLILITSSWFVALAVAAARQDRGRQVLQFIALAILCGIAFVVVKVVEYTGKFEAGLSMLTNNFFMYYFVLTGIHLLHVIAGIVVLSIIWSKARNGAYSSSGCKGLESGATYWHLVDLLWIMLFPLLYLMR